MARIGESGGEFTRNITTLMLVPAGLVTVEARGRWRPRTAKFIVRQCSHPNMRGAGRRRWLVKHYR